MYQRTMGCPLASLLVAVAALSGCSTERVNSATDAHTALLRGYVDALNRGDESYLDEYFGPGYVYHGPDGDLDVEAFKALHHSLLTAFPGGTMSADDILVAGDKVTTRWTFHGVQSGDFQGVGPTGREVTLTGIIISRVEDGKVVEEWEELDRLGLMQQLGVIPSPGGGAEP